MKKKEHTLLIVVYLFLTVTLHIPVYQKDKKRWMRAIGCCIEVTAVTMQHYIDRFIATRKPLSRLE